MAARTVDPIYIARRILTPAGTLQTSPLITIQVLPRGTLEAVDLTIPPGHRGFTGFSLRLAGTTILPFSNPAAFIVADDLQETFVLGVEIDTGVTVQTYNIGQYPHAFYLRYRIRQVPVAAGVPAATIIPPNQLGAT